MQRNTPWPSPQQYHYIEKEVYTEDNSSSFERTSFGRWEYVKGEVPAP